MNPNHLRVIKTARTEAAINRAVDQGFRPLVKPVVPSPDIKNKYAVLQDGATGKIQVVHDYRAWQLNEELHNVIDFRFYYPYHFPSPFAAYLIPSDIKSGERVWIEDLIEDIVASTWNQGDVFRLSSSEAIWDGTEFIVQHKPLEGYAFVG